MYPSPVVALSHPGLILSSACDPFPQALVQRVRAEQFVEMRDLLADNIALLSQLSWLQGVGTLPLSTVHCTRLCEVLSLLSWIYCFAAYVAIRTPDQLTRKMLVYAWLIIREALKHGGPGWAEYDRVFRRQLSINPLLSWNTLEPRQQPLLVNGTLVALYAVFARNVTTHPLSVHWLPSNSSFSLLHQLWWQPPIAP